MIETGVVHGRFQVFHLDHLKYILAGKSRCRHLAVGITNPDPSLTGEDPADSARSSPGSNPLTYFERYSLVRAALLGAGIGEADISVVPFPINFPDLYRYYVPMEATFFLTIYDGWGKRKLSLFRSAHLKTEVLWTRPREQKGITGHEVRRRMAEDEPWEDLVPSEAAELMKKWDVPGRLKKMREGLET